MPSGTALEREQPVLDVGPEALEDRGVELDQVALRIALLGPVDLVRMGHAHSVDRRRVAAAFTRRSGSSARPISCATSSRGLTSRGWASIFRSSAGGSPSAAFSMLPPSSRAISTRSRSETTERGSSSAIVALLDELVAVLDEQPRNLAVAVLARSDARGPSRRGASRRRARTSARPSSAPRPRPATPASRFRDPRS